MNGPPTVNKYTKLPNLKVNDTSARAITHTHTHRYTRTHTHTDDAGFAPTLVETFERRTHDLDKSKVKRHISHVTRHTSHVTRHSSHVK
jgi:hypothetical protein